MAEQYIFMITQLGEDGSPKRQRADTVTEAIIEPIAKAHHLMVERSDKVTRPGVVTNQIVQLITEARVIVADLTGKNTNVYYELGIADSFAKPVILLVNKTTELPFDNQHARVIEIGDDGDDISWKQANDAKELFAEFMKSVLDDTFAVDNVVTSAATAQALTSLAPNNAVAASLAEIKEGLAEIRGLVASRSPLVRPEVADPKGRILWAAVRTFLENEGLKLRSSQISDRALMIAVAGSFDSEALYEIAGRLHAAVPLPDEVGTIQIVDLKGHEAIWPF